MLKKLVKILVALIAVAAVLFVGGRIYYAELLNGPDLVPPPDTISLKPEFPPPAGWSESTVAATRAYADSLASSAVIVLRDGHIVAEWGRTDQRSSVHSVRKSLVSALYGIAIDRGLIDINKTLGELGIDDANPPLSDLEKSARIVDLLTARSGIYHPSIKDDNGPYPAPGTHRPDEEFVYNNWSFNAVGGIFEQLTHLSLGDAFDQWIARPIGMRDFRPEDVRYTEGSESVFPAYRFWMSARDLALFGQLYLNGGRWGDRQVIPADWIMKSLYPYSSQDNGVGYGYMWWLMPDSSYMATGTGGQKIRVYPNTKTVVINRVYTGAGLERTIWWLWGGRVNNGHITKLLQHLDADLADITAESGSQ